jgi:hypothetical protein
MTDISPTTISQKNCVVWSERRARNIELRVYYYVQEQDGCKVFTLHQIVEEG